MELYEYAPPDAGAFHLYPRYHSVLSTDEKPSERQGKAPLAVGHSHSDFVVCRGGLALLAASL